MLTTDGGSSRPRRYVVVSWKNWKEPLGEFDRPTDRNVTGTPLDKNGYKQVREWHRDGDSYVDSPMVYCRSKLGSVAASLGSCGFCPPSKYFSVQVVFGSMSGLVAFKKLCKSTLSA